MTVVITGNSTMVNGGVPISIRSGSRSKTGGMRFSSSRIRSSGGIGSSSTQGGHPLAGADPSTTKLDIKHRFEITAKLGSGTYGKVSLAYDHKMDREVAVKLIKKSAIENKQDLVRIRREIRIMSMLKHPNIIQIYEVFENKDKIILVMEYANGGELYDYVSKFGSLPEAEARRIFRQITSAVLYCHKHKVAHRDLKLENILLDSHNNAKIADFGLSNYFNEKSLLTTFCGSPLYASPEIINGTPYKGPEVDCWSLGILLYTLVYGSMPFDGRDFNRMVRQIKRGAYYEPDTPSTASMLIRNMLRVNADRRADIDDIASHWWLNLEENMPVIQELPENQITDHTPLTERAEIMVVQDLADETDVFMEFGHLSATTRQKIEEFRRRRKEAEEYNENSPIKPPKARRTSTSAKGSGQELTSKEKSLRYQEEPKLEVEKPPPVSPTKMEKSAFQDPLERLRQLETRLQGGRNAPDTSSTTPKPVTESSEGNSSRRSSLSNRSKDESEPISRKTSIKDKRRKLSLKKEKQNSEDKPPTNERKNSIKSSEPTCSTIEERPPAFVSLTGKLQSNESGQHKDPIKPVDSEANKEFLATRKYPQQYWKLETDSLNVLMNQVLEQIERGPVSMNLVARIKAHVNYDHRPMVKELLESIIAAQPPSVQKEASKIIQQQSQELVRRQISNNAMNSSVTSATKKSIMDTVPEKSAISSRSNETDTKNKYQVAQLPIGVDLKKVLGKTSLVERLWHSVEVGFSTDDDTSSNNSAGSDANNNVSRHHKNSNVAAAPKFVGTRSTQSEPEEFEDEEDEFYDAEDDEEEYESEIDELAEFVEQVSSVNEAENDLLKCKNNEKIAPPTIVENLAESVPQNPDRMTISTNHLSTLERGLSKRQSKGKYQFLHNQVEMYGRGVSTEAESPPPSKRRIGGPQPRPEQSPILFDKAKNYIMNYPDKINDSDTEESSQRSSKQKNNEISSKQKWLKTHDPEISLSDNKSSSSTVAENSNCQELPVTICEKETQPESSLNTQQKLSDNEEESEEEEESNDENARPFRPRPSTIIGFRTIQPPGSDGVCKEAPIVKVKPQTSSYSIIKPSSSKLTEVRSSPIKNEATLTTITAQRSLDKPSYQPNKNDATSKNLSINGDETSNGEDKTGKPRHESAAAYIRRKNRERRARNQTIAIMDDSWNRVPDTEDNGVVESDRPPVESLTTRRKSSLTGLNRFSVERLLDGTETYSRPSYIDERRQSYDSNSGAQTYTDRRKSFHEYTPNYGLLEDRCLSPFSSGAYERYGVGNFGAVGSPHLNTLGMPPPPVPSSLSRFEGEVMNAFYPNSYINNSNWGNDTPSQRFEVYRTRAERAADIYGGYRSSGYHVSGSYDRPVSAYIPSSSYKSQRYDEFSNNPTTNNYQAPTNALHHRRSFYELERSTTPGAEPNLTNNTYSTTQSTYSSNTAKLPPDSPGSTSKESGGLFTRLKPVTRRLSSALREFENRKIRARSQSNECMFMVARDEISSVNDRLIGNRLMTPEVDYNYVSYHDTSTANGRIPQLRNTEQESYRGILRNKQSYDLDFHSSIDSATTSGNTRTTDILSSTAESTVPKKRSLLNMARRRTTEVTTNSFMADDDYKRPRSPIDKIKSLFRGKNSVKDSTAGISPIGGSYTVSAYPTPTFTSSAVLSRYNKALPSEKLTSYHHTTAPSSSSSKRYTATSSRYGLTSGSVGSTRTSPRNWNDDGHNY